jgi:hypothetical protein
VPHKAVAANNRYAGFGPGTANVLRKMIGLREATWHEIDQKGEEYPTLLDY